MEEVKKRSSDGAATAAGGDTDIITVPKKRGRPSKPNQEPKKPSSGRGRGRPPKNAAPGAPVDIETSSDDDRPKVAETNGADVQSRNRPMKAAAAVGVKQKSARVEAAKILKQQKMDEESDEPQPVKATGGGRGRPKKNPVVASPSKAATVAVGIKRKQENGDIAEVPKKRGRPSSGVAKPQPKAIPKTIAGKPRGRPKKTIVNDDQDSDEGGVSSGSIKSVEIYNNVASSSRGQSTPKPSSSRKSVGRPKKLNNSVVHSSPNEKNEGEDDAIKDEDEDDKIDDDNDSSSSSESSEISSPKVKDKSSTKITT